MTDKDVGAGLLRAQLLTNCAALEDVLIWTAYLHCWCQEHKSSLPLLPYLHVASVQSSCDFDADIIFYLEQVFIYPQS